MSSRIYSGFWRVRVVFEWYGEDVFDFTDPLRYEDAERLCLDFGLGMPYQYGLAGVRIKRARIVSEDVS